MISYNAMLTFIKTEKSYYLIFTLMKNVKEKNKNHS